MSNLPETFVFDEATFRRSVRLFERFHRRLDVRVEIENRALAASSSVFAINRFAAFETFIPQYLVCQATDGDLVCSLAPRSQFTADENMADYLGKIGVVPEEHLGWEALLATRALNGHRVVVPTRTAVDLHCPDPANEPSGVTNAAHLAAYLELVRQKTLKLRSIGAHREVAAVGAHFGFAAPEAWLERLAAPISITPACLALYPTGLEDDFLSQGVEYLYSRQRSILSRDLFVSSDVIASGSDVQITFADPIEVMSIPEFRQFVDRTIADFDPFNRTVHWSAWRGVFDLIEARCREAIEASLNINLTHVALRLARALQRRGVQAVDAQQFERTLYVALKHLQNSPDVPLHASVRDPDIYQTLLDGQCLGLRRLALGGGPLSLDEKGAYAVSDAGGQRLDSGAVWRHVDQAVLNAEAVLPSFEATETSFRFDDELRRLAIEKERYSGAKFAAINAAQSAVLSPSPYLLQPSKTSNGLGVVLVHGFLSSPAEVRPLAESLRAAGYPVFGVRLAGHGTSPWDLRDRTWDDWLDSVARGWALMQSMCDRVVLAGFSTGAGLALRFAASQPKGLAAVVAISAAVKFRNPAMSFVPLVHSANQFVRLVSSAEGILLFSDNDPEHPDINYQHIPVRALNELRKLSEEVVEQLPNIAADVFVMHGDADPVIDPESLEIIANGLRNARTVKTALVRSDIHGIVYDDIDHTHAKVLQYLQLLCQKS
ncbi:MAG: alpha/beta fold hydrolase [Gammaproteobacteria bacterium]|nr:alpha/beta fold hydrolase [Gammaproteobacteria bacterium]